MSESLAGLLFAASLCARPRCRAPAAGGHAVLDCDVATGPGAGTVDVPHCRSGSEGRAVLGFYARSVLAFSAMSSCFCTAPSATAPFVASPGISRGEPAPGVEHSGQLRHQHQLAVVFGRVDDGLPGADVRSRGSELRVRRGWYGRVVRLGAGLRAGETTQPGQLLGGPARICVRILLPLRSSARSCLWRPGWCKTCRRVPT